MTSKYQTDKDSINKRYASAMERSFAALMPYQSLMETDQGLVALIVVAGIAMSISEKAIPNSDLRPVLAFASSISSIPQDALQAYAEMSMILAEVGQSKKSGNSGGNDA